MNVVVVIYSFKVFITRTLSWNGLPAY